MFVPSRKQSQLTAIDMITYAAAEGQPDRFLTVPEAEIAPVVETIREPALQQTLGHGVGFIHQGTAEGDRKRVEKLYREGVIKVGWRGRCPCARLFWLVGAWRRGGGSVLSVLAKREAIGSSRAQGRGGGMSNPDPDPYPLCWSISDGTCVHSFFVDFGLRREGAESPGIPPPPGELRRNSEA